MFLNHFNTTISKINFKNNKKYYFKKQYVIITNIV